MINLEYILDKIITFILLPVVVISFIINSLSSDPQIYQGIARLTDYFGIFPQNVGNIWEVKSISNRLINYLLYKFASLFIPYSEHYLQGIIIKIVSLIIVLVICYYFSRQVKIKYSFQVSSILILSTSNVATLQAEWWAVVFTLLAIGLIMDENQWVHILSGFVISIVFFFKGISGMFMVTFLCIVYLFKPDFEKLKNITMSMLAGFIVLTSMILFSPIFPNVLNDIILSSKIAPVGRFSLDLLAANFGIKSFVSLIDLPFLLMGLLFGAYLYICYMRNKEFKTVAVFVLMWLTCIFMVLVQSEFFTYHYVVLVIPTIITILLVKDYIPHAPFSAIIVTFVLFLMFTSFWSAHGIEERIYWDKKNYDANVIIKQFPDLQNQSSMLYLEACNAPYYFGVNATSRYICALPFQRNAPEWNITGLREYKENYVSIMSYTGKYIIFEDSNWFAMNTTSDNIAVGNKINNEYIKVYDEGSWRVWERKDNITSKLQDLI